MFTKLLTLISTVFLLLFSPAVALAQTASQSATSTNVSPINTVPSSISPTSPLYTDMILHNMLHSLSCLASGNSVIGQPCLTYQITKDAQGKLQSIPILAQTNLSGGALGGITGIIGGLYQNPPVRSVNYLASVGEQLGLVKTAHAQGVVGSGAGVLEPVLALWQVSRNVAYLVMVVIFVVIGVMVMFRNRINPQTVITAQAALPGLVIGLILITFSYFLASLIADTAFVGTNLVGAYYSAVRGESDNPQNLVRDISNQSLIKVFGGFTGVINKDNASSALNSIWSDLPSWPKSVLTMLAIFLTAQTTQQSTELFRAIPGVGEAIQATIIGISSGATLANPTGMLGIALAFIATAVLIYTMFMLLLRLVRIYLSIILLTVTAPFQFLFSALPGRQGIATGWIMNMLANALAFPAVLAVIYFAAFILGPTPVRENCVDPCPFKVSQTNQGHTGSIISPAFAEEPAKTVTGATIIGNATFPLFGGIDLDFVRVILAFGALAALPAIPEVIQKAIGSASQAGQVIGQELGGNIRQGQGYYGQFNQGIGTASGQFAKARSLFDTESYHITSFENGKPVYGLNPLGSHIGALKKPFAKRAYQEQLAKGR